MNDEKYCDKNHAILKLMMNLEGHEISRMDVPYLMKKPTMGLRM